MQRCTLLPLLAACAAATTCPDDTWLPWGGKCYSKRERGTHAECAAICGPNASLAHIESELENEFVSLVADGDTVWIGFYKVMLHPNKPGMWGRWTDSEEDGESFTKWARDQPNDVLGAENYRCRHVDER